MKEKQTLIQTTIETVQQFNGSLAAPQNHCWLSGTLAQLVTGDCSISSLWRTRHLSERGTLSLGNSSQLISCLRGAGCAIYKDMCVAQGGCVHHGNSFMFFFFFKCEWFSKISIHDRNMNIKWTFKIVKGRRKTWLSSCAMWNGTMAPPADWAAATARPPRETPFNSASYRVLHREIMVTHSLKWICFDVCVVHLKASNLGK